MTGIETEHLTVDGRCLCGQVRYRVAGERSGIIVCHCQRCRKHTGAAFVSFAVFESGDFSWLSGGDALQGFPSAHRDDGRSFCGICGSSMPAASRAGNGLGGIRAGNLLDMPPAGLTYHFYTASKCPWTEVPTDARQWATVADDFRDPHLPDLKRHVDPDRITGSCLCGTVAFEADRPLMMVNCHCSRCRLSRASAHATNLFVSADGFRWRSGEDSLASYRLPEAERFSTAFCRHCGSLMPRPAGQGDRINVPAGCLDTDPGVRPVGHIFVGSKAPWFEITDALPQWETRPPGRRAPSPPPTAGTSRSGE